MLGIQAMRTNRQTRKLAAAFLVLLSFALVPGRTVAEEQIRVAKPAPAFELKDLEGHDVKLSDFDGQALLVVFWASWDKNCKIQLPILTELQTQYGGKQFTVIGISLDSAGPDAVKSFAEEHKINFPILMFDLKVVQDFGGLNAIPTSYLIDKNHNIIEKHVGWVEKNAFETDLKAILKK